MQLGSRSYPLGFRNEGKMNAMKNYGIVEGKVLEYMRELTEGEGIDRWAGQPRGGASRPHMSSPCGSFSLDGFLCLTNPKKDIFAL